MATLAVRPLKNAFVAFFNLAKCEAKLDGSQNNDLRRYFVIASMRCRSPSNNSTGWSSEFEPPKPLAQLCVFNRRFVS